MRIPILTLIILIVVSILCDWFILHRIRKECAPQRKRLFSSAYGISVIIMWVILIVFICWPKRDPYLSIVAPMWLLFVYLTVYIPKIIFCLISLIISLFTRKWKKRKAWDRWVAFPVSFILFLFMWSGVFYTGNQIEVNRVEIKSDRLPKSLDGTKILQLSDIHLGTWGSDTTFISRFTDSINAQKADIVVFTGDFVNRASNEMTPFIPVLKRIKAPLGVYAVLGNHDYGGYADWPDDKSYKDNLKNLTESIDALGWTLLCNQTSMISNGVDSIAMIGVENWGEPPFNQLGDLAKSYKTGSPAELNDSVYKVLLTHNPNHWTEIVTKTSNVDLTLSGHTHAMQLMFSLADWKWSPSKWRYPQWGGLYTHTEDKKNPMHLYVNIGAGDVGMPVRMGSAKPEINIITLRSSR